MPTLLLRCPVNTYRWANCTSGKFDSVDGRTLISSQIRCQTHCILHWKRYYSKRNFWASARMCVRVFGRTNIHNKWPASSRNVLRHIWISVCAFVCDWTVTVSIVSWNDARVCLPINNTQFTMGKGSNSVKCYHHCTMNVCVLSDFFLCFFGS